MKNIKPYITLGIVLLVIWFIFLLQCNGEEFKILSFNADRTEAELGQAVTISWSYQGEDQLENQKLLFLKSTFTGIEEEEISLSNSRRSYSFNLEGTREIILVAEAEEKTDQASITIYLKQDFYFRLRASNNPDPLYPYLGYPMVISNGGNCAPSSSSYINSVDIEFTDFFAFYDEPENGIVDDLAGVLPNDSFFRALSMSVYESEDFSLREGSLYPSAVFMDPSVGNSNVILFGGKIITDGEEHTFKTKNGEGSSRLGVDDYQQIFIAIVLRIGFTAEVVDIVDIQMGNLNQGLVTTLNYNDLGSMTSISSGFYKWKNIGTLEGSMEGNIKQAILGYPITKTDGTILNVFVNLSNIQFYMAMLPDNMIDGFIE